MRNYGKVYSSFWSSGTTGSLGDDGKLLALYLQTCVHSTIAGVFRLPDGYAAEDLRWDPERVRDGFRELLSKGFANRCESTKWVWVAKHLEWNRPENQNQVKAVLKVVATVPEQCTWKPEFMRVCGPALGLQGGTVAEPLATQEQEQKQEQQQKQQQKQKAARKRAARGFDASTISLPPWLPLESWQAWVADRKERRKPVTERAATGQLAKLQEYRNEGHDPASVIANSIAGGYQGLFPERQRTNHGHHGHGAEDRFRGAL